MELQTREADETTGPRYAGEPSFAEKLVKSAIIGAIVTAGGYLLYKFSLGTLHTIPPIIIKSVGENTEIESKDPLDEARHVGPDIQSTIYRMRGFKRTRQVKIFRGKIPHPPYKKSSGLVVQLWLQRKENNQWQDEPGGPHLIVNGTSEGFPLSCDPLSTSYPNPGNSNRPHKRSYHKNNQKWRIGKVQVDSDMEISTSGYNVVEVEFYDHAH